MNRPAPSLRLSVFALLAKQWALQKRAWMVNLLLVFLPVFFCVVLLLLQVLVNVELRCAAG